MGLRRAHVGNRRSYVVTMATLQDIPSGEALATSRPKINSNFAALNTELGQKETPTGAQAKADAALAAAISAAAAAQATADSKQAALANAGTLAKVSESAGLPLWDGAAWPGGGSGGPITASSITDAGTAGIAVLQAETQAQVRAAAGFGGTVTVAQLNAAGADARSAMYYCSDCLTVNGPGSLVAWCGRTSTWRTLDDCLLATTDFPAWCNDYLVNSNSSELRGSKGALFRGFDNTQGIAFSTVNGAVASPSTTYAQPYLHRRFKTNTNANGYGRALGVSIGGIDPGTMRVFSGVRRLLPAAITGVTVRVGISTLSVPTNALTTTEDSLCIDAGDVLGAINAGKTQNYCACIRVSSVNQAGSGATTVAASTGTPHDLMVIRDLGATSMFVNGGVVASGTGYGGTAILYPFFIAANDGTSTNSVFFDFENFAFGYLLP